MITHKEVKDELQHYVSEYGMDYYGEKHFPITTKYITQQEKVSKLLELYRLEKELREQYYTADIVLMSQKILDMVRGVAEEIKALEEELK